MKGSGLVARTRRALTRALAQLCLLLPVAMLAACDSSSSDPDEDGARPLLRAFHAAPDLAAVTFLREEESWSSLEYGADTEFRGVDADQYDLNFDAWLPGDSGDATRLATVSANLVPDREYTVVLVGRYGDLEIAVYDKPWHDFDTEDEDEDGDPEDKNAEIQLFHLADALGDVDVYLEAPGTNWSAVEPLVSFAPRDHAHGFLPDEGTYQLALTAPADPATVLFVSDTFTLSRQTRVSFAILDAADEGSYAYKVQLFGDRGTTLLDRNRIAELRASHAAPGTGSVDVIVGSEFDAPLAAGIAFGGVSDYAEVPAGDLNINVTPAGNPGVFVAEKEITTTTGRRMTFFLLGTPGALNALAVTDDYRRIATHARYRVINGTTHFSALDVYVVEPGSNIHTQDPTVSALGYRIGSGLKMVDPGEYDFVLTESSSDTVVFGPMRIELDAGGIYTIVTTDADELTAADVLLLDDFAN